MNLWIMIRFFASQIDLIKKSENLYLMLLERRNLTSIVNKIYKAICSDNPRFRYSAPLTHNLFAKIIKLILLIFDIISVRGDFMTDIEIARKAKMFKIDEIAKKLNISDDYLEILWKV